MFNPASMGVHDKVITYHLSFQKNPDLGIFVQEVRNRLSDQKRLTLLNLS